MNRRVSSLQLSSQYTPVRGRQQIIFPALLFPALISIHTRKGTATITQAVLSIFSSFQYTPVRGRQLFFIEIYSKRGFQYTPVRGRQLKAFPRFLRVFKSQYTPVRGQNVSAHVGTVDWNRDWPGRAWSEQVRQCPHGHCGLKLFGESEASVSK